MGIAVAGRTTDTGTGTGDSPTLPSHAIGDLLLVIVSTDGPRVVSESSGLWFVTGFTSGSSTNATTIGFAMKVATSASETVTLSWGASETFAIHAWNITGHGVVDPATDVGFNGTAGAATTISFNPATANPAVPCLGIASVVTAYGTAPYSPTVASTGFSQLRSTQSSGTIAGTSITSQERLYAAGTTTVAPSTQTRAGGASQWLSGTLAIPEAGVAPTDTLKIQVGDVQLGATKLYAGDTKVNKVYAGDVLIYEDA